MLVCGHNITIKVLETLILPAALYGCEMWSFALKKI